MQSADEEPRLIIQPLTIIDLDVLERHDRCTRCICRDEHVCFRCAYFDAEIHVLRKQKTGALAPAQKSIS